MTLIDKAEAHDDDLIRRGDVLREIANEGLHILDAAIAALPARGVGVVCTWPSCPHTAKGQCQPSTRILAALAPTDAAHVNETPKSEHDGADVLTDAAQARE